MREQFEKLLHIRNGNGTRVADMVRTTIQARKDEADWKRATRELRDVRKMGGR